MNSTRQAFKRFFGVVPPHALLALGAACVLSGLVCLALDAPRIYPNALIALGVCCSLLLKICHELEAQEGAP